MAQRKIYYVPTIDHNCCYVGAEKAYQFRPDRLSAFAGRGAVCDGVQCGLHGVWAEHAQAGVVDGDPLKDIQVAIDKVKVVMQGGTVVVTK